MVLPSFSPASIEGRRFTRPSSCSEDNPLPYARTRDDTYAAPVAPALVSVISEISVGSKSDSRMTRIAAPEAQGAHGRSDSWKCVASRFAPPYKSLRDIETSAYSRALSIGLRRCASTNCATIQYHATALAAGSRVGVRTLDAFDVLPEMSVPAELESGDQIVWTMAPRAFPAIKALDLSCASGIAATESCRAASRARSCFGCN